VRPEGTINKQPRPAAANQVAFPSYERFCQTHQQVVCGQPKSASVGCSQLTIGEPNDPQGRISLWPCGLIPYRFVGDWNVVDPTALATLQNVLLAMQHWNDSLEGWVRFEPQDPADTSHFLAVQRSTRNISRNGYVTSSGPGQLPADVASQEIRVAGRSWGLIAHELAHTIGVAHLQNRADRDRWLRAQTAAEINAAICPERVVRVFGGTQREPVPIWSAVPLLDSFDYSGISLNAANVLKSDNSFVAASDVNGNRPVGSRRTISPGDVSRIQQYYSTQRHPGWGLFEGLAPHSHHLTGCAPRPPSPWLPSPLPGARQQFPAGTPAISRGDNADIVGTRGSDGGFYVQSVAADGVWTPGPPAFSDIITDPALQGGRWGRIDALLVFQQNPDDIWHVVRQGFDAWRDAGPVGGGPVPNGLGALSGTPSPPSLMRDDFGTLVAMVYSRDGTFYSSSLSPFNGMRWSPWISVDLDSLQASPSFTAALGPSGVYLAAQYQDATVVYHGHSAASLRIHATHLGSIAAGTRPAIAAMPEGGYRVFAARDSGETGSFSMLWSAADTGAWEPVGGLPEPGTSPSVSAARVNGQASALVMLERAPVDERGNMIQPGFIWRRHFA
jgi:hypothetical protein